MIHAFRAFLGPTAVLLVAAWAYMGTSALLIAEVNVNTLCATGKEAVSYSSMTEQTLGARRSAHR